MIDKGVSIVIRTLNEDLYIGKCLEMIRAQRVDFPVEIIVIDSGSTDKTRSIAASFGCLVGDILPENFSYGRALNLGVSQSRFEVLVAISAHCVPCDRDWLYCLTAPLFAGEAGMVFGGHVAGEGCRTSEKNYFKAKFDLEEGYCRLPLMNNGNSAFLKSLWLNRPFDEHLPAQEDVEFCLWHMIQSSSRLFFSARSTVHHYHNDRNVSLYRRIYKETAVERYIGALPWMEYFVFVFKFPKLVVQDVVLARRRGVLFRAIKGIFAFRGVQLCASFYAMVTHRSYVKRGGK